MNLKYAQYIMEVARQKNITSAAQKLYISQPSLSQIISKTEKELNALLFDRTPNGLILTKAGKMYIEAMQSAMLIDQDLRRKLEESQIEAKECIRIGISTQRVLNVLPSILSKVKELLPNLTFSIQSHPSSILEEMVQKGTLDLALAMTYPHNDSLSYTLLEKQNVVLYASKNTQLSKTHPNKSSISIIDAKDERFISLTPGHNSRSIQDRLFFSYDISPQILVETNEMQVGKALVEDLNAVMICLLMYLWSPQTHSITGNYFFLNHVTCSRSLYAIYRKDTILTDSFNSILEISKQHFAHDKGILNHH